MYWYFNGNAVVYSPEPLTHKSIEIGTNVYHANLYTHRFLSKWEYRADYTMLYVDTHVDGNKYLMIFDNNKEQKDLT